MVEFKAKFTNKTDPKYSAGNAGDLEFSMTGKAESVGIDGFVRKFL